MSKPPPPKAGVWLLYVRYDRIRPSFLILLEAFRISNNRVPMLLWPVYSQRLARPFFDFNPCGRQRKRVTVLPHCPRYQFPERLRSAKEIDCFVWLWSLDFRPALGHRFK